MPNTTRDPIQAVKSFLRERTSKTGHRSTVSAVAQELRELQDRLTRARNVEARVGLSDILEGLLGQSPGSTTQEVRS